MKKVDESRMPSRALSCLALDAHSFTSSCPIMFCLLAVSEGEIPDLGDKEQVEKGEGIIVDIRYDQLTELIRKSIDWRRRGDGDAVVNDHYC